MKSVTVEGRNRFKGLDLIDRVPEELWMEVCKIVQESGIKTIPKKMKCKKAKWLTEEAFLVSPCYSLELCIQMDIILLLSFAFRFSTFHSYL